MSYPSVREAKSAPELVPGAVYNTCGGAKIHSSSPSARNTRVGDGADRNLKPDCWIASLYCRAFGWSVDKAAEAALTTALLKTWLAGLLSAFVGISAAHSQTYEPDPNLPAAVQMHGRCAAKAGREACWGFAVRPEIPAYSQPDASNRIISKYPLASYISLIEPSESGEHPGWVSVVAVINNKYLSAWVRHADIVLASDLPPAGLHGNFSKMRS